MQTGSAQASRAAVLTVILALLSLYVYKSVRRSSLAAAGPLKDDPRWQELGDDIGDLRRQYLSLSEKVQALESSSDRSRLKRPEQAVSTLADPRPRPSRTTEGQREDGGSYLDTSPAKKERRVIAYSLYNGHLPRYSGGATENVRLWKSVFPDWEMWIYHDKTTPESVLASLRDSGVKLIDMTNSGLTNAMTWRFTVASDNSVDRFIVRDIDARLSQRDKDAVDEWIASGKKFHVVRDHPSHSNYPMSGGLWGATKDAIPNIIELLNSKSISKEYIADMNWLTNAIWPIAKASVLQHDSFSCDKFGGGVAFPSEREYPEQHIGSVHLKLGAKERKGDSDMLLKAIRMGKQPAECKDRTKT